MEGLIVELNMDKISGTCKPDWIIECDRTGSWQAFRGGAIGVDCLGQESTIQRVKQAAREAIAAYHDEPVEKINIRWTNWKTIGRKLKSDRPKTEIAIMIDSDLEQQLSAVTDDKSAYVEKLIRQSLLEIRGGDREILEANRRGYITLARNHRTP